MPSIRRLMLSECFRKMIKAMMAAQTVKGKEWEAGQIARTRTIAAEREPAEEYPKRQTTSR